MRREYVLKLYPKPCLFARQVIILKFVYFKVENVLFFPGKKPYLLVYLTASRLSMKMYM